LAERSGEEKRGRFCKILATITSSSLIFSSGEWFLKRDDIFTYMRPEAGAFVYCEYKLPINSTELINRLRVEQSVLLTAGDQHGLDKGIRTGFGYGVEKTLKGLARAETLMRSLK
jgi:DNA-binding transcriptional MocR family regulator